MRTLALVTALATIGTAALAQRPAAPQQAPQATQPAPPAAQQPQAQFGPGARGGLALFLSTNPQALNLTSAQLTRIQAANERAQQANAALRQQIQTATANRDLATLGLAERHALMVRVRGMRQQMQDNIDSATTVAIATLNTEQQRTIQAMHQMRGGMGGGAMRPGMRGGMQGRGMRGGMMGGGMRGGMMMPGQMMPGGMRPGMAPGAGTGPQRPL